MEAIRIEGVTGEAVDLYPGLVESGKVDQQSSRHPLPTSVPLVPLSLRTPHMPPRPGSLVVFGHFLEIRSQVLGD